MRLVVVLILFVSGLARAEEPHWDDATRLALGQCLVGEAHWTNRIEHAAISYVLKRRWETVKIRYPSYRFIRMIRQYCAVHRTTDPTPRQRWILALTWETMDADPGMRARWTNYVSHWDYVRDTVTLFERGELKDPLPDAMHWGSLQDSPPKNTSLLERVVYFGGEAVALENLFYRID